MSLWGCRYEDMTILVESSYLLGQEPSCLDNYHLRWIPNNGSFEDGNVWQTLSQTVGSAQNGNYVSTMKMFGGKSMILTILWRPPESREVASFSLQKLLTEAIVPFNPMVLPIQVTRVSDDIGGGLPCVRLWLWPHATKIGRYLAYMVYPST